MGAFDGFLGAHLGMGFMDRARAALANPDLRPAWREARKPVRGDQRDHAKRQIGPDGTWAPRSSETKRRGGMLRGRRRRPHKPLGRLPTGIALRAERDRMVVRSMIRFSLVHQEGGRAGYGAKIPRRTFLWLSDPAGELVAGIVARILARVGFGG